MEFIEFEGYPGIQRIPEESIDQSQGPAGSPISPLSNVEFPATICWRPAARIPESKLQNPECTL